MAKFDAAYEAARLKTATREDLEQLERTNRMRATPVMKQRHALVVAELRTRDLNELQNFHK